MNLNWMITDKGGSIKHEKSNTDLQVWGHQQTRK